MSFAPPGFEDSRSRAMSRTNVPGILLIVVGVINIFGALYFIANGGYSALNPEKAAEGGEMISKMFDKSGAAAKQDPEQIKMMGVGYVVLGLLSLVGCFITIMGGVRMRSLQSYSLAMLGSVISAIPCISCLGCCAIGEIVGIWAVVVLLNQEVKAAFQQGV